MRRNVGLFLTALGAFLVVTGILVRVYAYPALAKVPLDQDSVTYLSAEDATVFNISTLKPEKTSLHVEATTVGDVTGSEKAGDNIALWAGTTTAKTGDGTVVQKSTSLSAFDRTSSMGVNCCGAFIEDTEAGNREKVDRTSGLVYKFPFDTQKKDYMVFDDQARKSYKAVYKGEETLEGVTVYKFVQDVPRQQVGVRDVPSELLGLPGKNRAVEAGQYYKNRRTFLVEPNTGAYINRIEEQYQTLTWKGEDKVVATEATVQFTKKQVQDFVDTVGAQGPMLGLIRNVVPWVMGIVGLVLAALGLYLQSAVRKEEPEATRKKDKVAVA